jgi:hypothetical protein
VQHNAVDTLPVRSQVFLVSSIIAWLIPSLLSLYYRNSFLNDFALWGIVRPGVFHLLIATESQLLVAGVIIETIFWIVVLAILLAKSIRFANLLFFFR